MAGGHASRHLRNSSGSKAREPRSIHTWREGAVQASRVPANQGVSGLLRHWDETQTARITPSGAIRAVEEASRSTPFGAALDQSISGIVLEPPLPY
jgi:hypothetical protein